MPHVFEQRCCQRLPLERTHIPDAEEGKCLLECVNVAQCIGEVNVQTSWLVEMQNYGHRGDALRFTHMSNKNYRHHAYKRFIGYIHGYLGRYNRKIVPACIVDDIRRRWPDADGNYVGFQALDDDGQMVDMDEIAEIDEDI